MVKKAQVAAVSCMFQQMPVKQEPVLATESAPTAEEKKQDIEQLSFVDRVFGSKAKYNSFIYRLRKKNAQVQEDYKELQDEGEDEAIKEFVAMIVSSRGPLPADAISRKRKHIDETTKDIEEGWVSWSTAAKAEGEDVLLELVETGEIPSRRHPKLSHTSKIRHPNYLQVFLSKEKSHKKEGAHDETELSETTDAEQAHHHETFLKEITAAKMNAMIEKEASSSATMSSRASVTSSEDVSNIQGKPPVDEKTKLAIRHLRKQHSSWDRTKREFEGAVAESKMNDNTQGSKIEKELEKLWPPAQLQTRSSLTSSKSS